MNNDNIPTYRLPTTTTLELPLLVSRLNPAHSTGWDSVPDRHTFYAIFWITAGQGQHVIDFVAHDIRPNSLFLLCPNQTHFFEVSEPIAGHTLFFNEQIVYRNTHTRQMAKLFYLAEQQPAYYPTATQSDIVTGTMAQLYREFHADEAGRVEAISHLVQFLFIQIQRIYNLAVLGGHSEAETKLTAEFQHLVGQQFATHHRLNDYANQLGVSTGYLNSQVKTVTGRSAAEHIRQRILVEAMRLLTHTEMSAAEIAWQIGFKDNAYFGRFFKRETGQTPLTFRRTRYEKYHLLHK